MVRYELSLNFRPDIAGCPHLGLPIRSDSARCPDGWDNRREYLGSHVAVIILHSRSVKLPLFVSSHLLQGRIHAGMPIVTDTDQKRAFMIACGGISAAFGATGWPVWRVAHT
jgi:hypothetical protein